MAQAGNSISAEISGIKGGNIKLETYREKLTELEKLPWTEYRQKAAELQAEYLSEQVVPDALGGRQVHRRSTTRDARPDRGGL